MTDLTTSSSAFMGLNPWNIPGDGNGDTTVSWVGTLYTATQNATGQSTTPQVMHTAPGHASTRSTSPSEATGSMVIDFAATTGPSTFTTELIQTTASSRAAVTTAIDPVESMGIISSDRKPPPRASKLAVGLAVPATVLLLIACILLGMYLRRRHRDWSTTRSPYSPRILKSHKHDFNAKPLYPHQPLATRSDSTFTADAGPSYGSIPQPGDSSIPQLPELEGLTTAHSPMSEHASDDFGTYFSGLDDPLTDAATSTREMTPGVSPSSHPLRDRLNHGRDKRRKAIGNVKHGGSRASISERELGELVTAFDAIENKMQEERKVRVRSEGNVWRDSERGGSPAGMMASVPLS